ncbi:MAG: hypothetical protein WA786_01515 [Acidimicrobiales bacterium]
MKRTLRVVITFSTAVTLSAGLASVASSTIAPRLTARLLSVTQMPGSWSVDTPSGSVQAGCLTNVIGLSSFLIAKGVKQTSHASIIVEDNQSVPVVSEMLATYTNPAVAYERIVSSLARCKHVNASVLGQTVTGTMKEKTLAHFANASQAFTASTSILGTTFDEDVIVVRKANVVMGLIEGGLPPVNSHQFEGIVTRALARVP